jgi:F0F1-type ATP synthase assembly protein I
MSQLQDERRRTSSDEHKRSDKGLWQTAAFVSGLGIYFAVVIGICIFIGRKIDESFGTGPYGTLAGIVLGFPVAIYSTYRKIRGII